MPMIKTPEEIAMEAALKADLATKFDLTDVPAPVVIGDPAAVATSATTEAIKAEDAPKVKEEKAAQPDLVAKLMDRIEEMEGKCEAERKAFEERLAARAEYNLPPPEPKREIQVPVQKGPSWDEFLADPAGVAEREKVPFDYIAASLVRAELARQGKHDPSLDAKLGQFPAVRAMTQQMEQLTTLVTSLVQERTEERYQAEITKSTSRIEKEKFPLVAGASAIDASAVAEELREIVMVDAKSKPSTAPRMTPEQAIATYEKRLALAKRLTAPAPTGTQGAPGNTSPKIPPATAANLSGTPAPIVVQSMEDADRALREEIVRKHPGN